jgi:hypothetical protein
MKYERKRGNGPWLPVVGATVKWWERNRPMLYQRIQKGEEVEDTHVKRECVKFRLRSELPR